METQNINQAKAIENDKINPCLAIVREWLSQLTYREKLAIALASELLNTEHCFTGGIMCNNAYPDDRNIGSELQFKCLATVAKASGDPDYLKTADVTEAAITSFVTALMSMAV